MTLLTFRDIDNYKSDFNNQINISKQKSEVISYHRDLDPSICRDISLSEAEIFNAWYGPSKRKEWR